MIGERPLVEFPAFESIFHSLVSVLKRQALLRKHATDSVIDKLCRHPQPVDLVGRVFLMGPFHTLNDLNAVPRGTLNINRMQHAFKRPKSSVLRSGELNGYVQKEILPGVKLTLSYISFVQSILISRKV
jgi:hypothetical protein